MDWVERINEKLDELGLYPEVEAADVHDLPGHIVLVDTQETTVYESAEGVYRQLAGVEPTDDLRATFEAVGHAIHPNLKEEIRVFCDAGLWRVNHEAMLAEEQE